MKSFLFAAGLVCFIVYRAEQFHVNLNGAWKNDPGLKETIKDVKFNADLDKSEISHNPGIARINMPQGYFMLANRRY